MVSVDVKHHVYLLYASVSLITESEGWSAAAGKRGVERGCRKARLEMRVPESEVSSMGAGKRDLEGGCRKARLVRSTGAPFRVTTGRVRRSF